MTHNRNEERIGSMPDISSPAPVVEQAGASFDFSVPTEFVDLPSKGIFYPEGHPLHNKESVEIRYMTAKDEDTLTNRSLINKGIVLDRLIKNILVNKAINVNSLLLGDKNAIIVAARSTGYGNIYDTQATCPSCYENSEQSFDLNSLKAQFPNKDRLEELAVTKNDDDTFSFTLPKTKAVVKARLLSGTDEKRLEQLQANKKKNNLPETPIVDQLRTCISEVNGNSDTTNVNKFIDVMPLLDGRYFRRIYSKLIPNIDMKHDFQCPHCDHEALVEVPLSADFFWPDR
jgi:hypothetical protein